MAITDRKQRERQARLNAILTAGRIIFSRYGYHSASMDLIAEEAELGKATLYYYFKSKDELLMAILESGIREFFDHLEQVLPQLPSPLEQIQQITRVSVDFFRSHPDYFKLYIYLNAHPAFRAQVLQKLQPIIRSKLNLFINLFEKAQREGLIKKYPAAKLISIFGSMVMGVGVFLENMEENDPRELADLINRVFLEGVLEKRSPSTGMGKKKEKNLNPRNKELPEENYD